MLERVLKIVDSLDPGAVGSFSLAENRPSAVLSTTVLPVDGIYLVREFVVLEGELQETPHYVTHESTKEFLELFLGAVPAPIKLFSGLAPGQWAVCFPIRQGKSLRGEDGTVPNQQVSPDDLRCRLIVRIS